jgi:sortase (surface protein transpeptidase)
MTSAFLTRRRVSVPSAGCASSGSRIKRLGSLGVVTVGALIGLFQLQAAAANTTRLSAIVAAYPDGLDGWEHALGHHLAPPAPPAVVSTAPARVSLVAASATKPRPRPPLPSGAVAWLTVPAIGLERPVYRGGQSTIDRGLATLFDDGPGGWRAPISPGAEGTLWIAGHHTSHGAPFLLVDRIKVGDVALVRGPDGVTYTYRFVARKIVGTSVNSSAVYGTDPAAHRMILQTSMGRTHRLLLTGSLVAVG